jgi:hypothetical protein
VSRRLHPSFPVEPSPVVRNHLVRQTALLGELLQLERARRPQPDPFGDVELVTTVRRSPRLTRANSSIDGRRGPAL